MAFCQHHTFSTLHYCVPLNVDWVNMFDHLSRWNKFETLCFPSTDETLCFPSTDSTKRIQDSPVSHQLSSLTITSANFADISSSAHTSPHRLSSHCPDVVNCHSSPLQQSYSSTGSEVKLSQTTGHFVAEDDVLFGGELAYASEDLKKRLQPVISKNLFSF